MHTITIDGTEYILRCDINAYEEIVGRYGDIKNAVDISEEKEGTKKLVFLLTTLINEHRNYIGERELLTEKQLSMMMFPGDATRAYIAVMETINDAFAPKN